MNIPTATIIYIATPFIESIIKDIAEKNLTVGHLNDIKNRLYAFAASYTGKTVNTVDDEVVAKIILILTTPALYQGYGDKLLDILEDWISSSATRWDDILLQPVITIFRQVAEIPDGDK
jgi:hypothetical protein